MLEDICFEDLGFTPNDSVFPDIRHPLREGIPLRAKNATFPRASDLVWWVDEYDLQTGRIVLRALVCK